jgi:hypothetical protein
LKKKRYFRLVKKRAIWQKEKKNYISASFKVCFWKPHFGFFFYFNGLTKSQIFLSQTQTFSLFVLLKNVTDFFRVSLLKNLFSQLYTEKMMFFLTQNFFFTCIRILHFSFLLFTCLRSIRVENSVRKEKWKTRKENYYFLLSSRFNSCKNHSHKKSLSIQNITNQKNFKPPKNIFYLLFFFSLNFLLSCLFLELLICTWK